MDGGTEVPCYWEGTTLHSLAGSLTDQAEVVSTAWWEY